jgi:hypothetical protein
MNYGIRYDLELNPTQEASGIPFGNDYNNFGPRFALSYDLTGQGHTFAKLSSGIFYDRIWNNATNDLYDLKDNQLRVSGTWTPSTPGAPIYPQTFTTKPATIPTGVVNVVIMPDEVHVPATAQFVGTLEHAFTPSVLLTGNMIYSRSWDKEYRVDRNLNWNGSKYTLIDPTYRQIRQYVFDAPAEYVGGVIQLTVRRAKIGFDTNLTFAHSRETAGVFSYPNDQVEGIRADWGPQPDTPRIRGVVNGWYNVNRNIQVSAIYSARTGLPLNPVASGLDLNGDGRFGDRTPGLAPFSFEMPGSQSVDARVSGTIPMPNGRKVSVFVEGFNIFNTENVRTMDSNYGSNPASPGPNWMNPLSYFDARQFQVGARLTF